MTEFTKEFIAEERERHQDNPRVGYFAIATGGNYRRALDEIERLQAEVTALKEAARRIPVTERLPEQGVRVRVWIGGTENIARLWLNTPQWETIDGLYYHGDTFAWVTGWLPLPEIQEDGTSVQDKPETFIETVNMDGQPVRVPFDILKQIARDVEIAAPIVQKDAEARKAQEEDGEA